MKKKNPNIRVALYNHLRFILLFLFFSGCSAMVPYNNDYSTRGTNTLIPQKTSQAKPHESFIDNTDTDTDSEIDTEIDKEVLNYEVIEKSDSGKTIEEKNQALVDSALEYYQKSEEFWEHGDVDNAIEALDKSYSLIIELKSDADQELLQQTEDLRITIAKRIMEVYASRLNAVNGHRNPIPMVMNEHVQNALNSFMGREKGFFINAYVRSGKYRPAIVKALREEGLPEELSWLPLIESGFKIRALSSARALGLWQFIASTGYKFGLERNTWVDERMDPEKSTLAAVAYFKELHDLFGDWTTALAAYNCGEARVLSVIRKQKFSYLDNFWDLYKNLPCETAAFVPRFIAVLYIVKEPEKYGFTLPPVDKEIEYEEVIIDKQIHLKTIAKNIGIEYDEFKNLNPELRNYLTPKEPYSLKVPVGKADVLLAKLNDIPVYAPLTPSYVVHKVRRGETLSSIASRYKTSVNAIMAMNSIKSSQFIKKGSMLKIPGSRSISSKNNSQPNRLIDFSGNLLKYVVKKGDSLWGIAKQFNITSSAIKSLNNLKTTTLSVGQVLLIPDKKETVVSDSKNFI